MIVINRGYRLLVADNEWRLHAIAHISRFNICSQAAVKTIYFAIRLPSFRFRP